MDGTTALYKVATREEAIEKYEPWFHRERLNNPEAHQLLHFMIGKAFVGEDINLVCYCAPKDCHCRHIKEYVEEMQRHYQQSYDGVFKSGPEL
jgi:hypothetical protein